MPPSAHASKPVSAEGAYVARDAMLGIVRRIDLEMYDITTPALPAALTLTLRHNNPALTLPPETAVIQQGFQLGLPVAKNGLIPPTA